VSLRAQHLSLLAGLLMVFAPLAGWYVGLVQDLNTLVPLGCLALFAARAYRRQPGHAVFADRRILVPITGLWLFGALQARLPPIAQAVLFACILASMLSLITSRRWMHPGLLGLGLLSLPLIPNVQFFFGYPLRRLVAELATPLLWLSGIPAQVQGTSIACGNHLVVVDAPCSGIKMMWVCAVLVCVFSCRHGFTWLRMLHASLLAFVLMLAANVLRASSLFMLESGLFPGEAWMHEAVGLVVFATFSSLLAWRLSRLGSHKPPAIPARPVRHLHSWIGVGLFAGGVSFSLAQNVMHADPTTIKAHLNLPALPDHFEGRSLTSRPLVGDELEISGAFPGRIARFNDGTNEIIIKQVVRATRKLHMAEVCFKSWGYALEHQPMAVDAEGQVWTTFTAEKNGRRLRVRECVKGPEGQHWPDVSAWYWSALAHPDAGPWNAWIVAERL
jgi:exosortase/archaeosortase family protein